MDLTVRPSGGQEDAGCSRRRAVVRRGRIAQGPQPVGGGVRQAAALQGAVALVETARGDAVVVPDHEQGQQARGESAVDGEVGAQHAVPGLDGAASAHGAVPGGEERCGDGAPGGGQLPMIAEPQDALSPIIHEPWMSPVRYWPGVNPITLLNVLEKWWMSENPQSSATRWSGKSVLCSMSLDCAIRSRMRY